jgi:hypothetical protein
MFLNETCTTPDPEIYRLARLTGGSSAVCDGCEEAAALLLSVMAVKKQRFTMELIIQDFIKEVEQEARDSMGVVKRGESALVYLVLCQNHLRMYETMTS